MRTRWLCLAAAILIDWTMAQAAETAPPLDLKVLVGALPTPPAAATPTPALSSNASASPRPTPPAVVSFKKLMEFLPKTPTGWTAEKPSGSVTDVEVFNLSTATQTYQKGDDENALVATVTIIDAGGHQGYLDVTTNHWKQGATTAEGYDKPVEIDGMPGLEHTNTLTHSASLSVLVGKRYFVQIDLTNQDAKELREWLKRIDLKGLAELR